MSGHAQGDVKKKIVKEFVDYWINVFYLTLVFAAFTQYRRIVLAAYDIVYTNYLIIFVALIPFFALKELERVLGEDKIRALFFRRRIGQRFEISEPGDE
jgi:hypothetical protein